MDASDHSAANFSISSSTFNVGPSSTSHQRSRSASAAGSSPSARVFNYSGTVEEKPAHDHELPASSSRRTKQTAHVELARGSKLEGNGLRQALVKTMQEGKQSLRLWKIRNKQRKKLPESFQRKCMGEDSVDPRNSLLLSSSGVENNQNGARTGGIKPELPFSAKIAAAMDADGLIGVEKQVADRQTLQRPKQYYPRQTEVRKAGLQKRSRKRWMVLRRLRRGRSLFASICRRIRRALSCQSV